MMLKHDFQSVNSLRDGFYMKPFLLLGSLKHQKSQSFADATHSRNSVTFLFG
jgi:hypothetical protein